MPADVLRRLAVGDFGGPVGANTVFPQTYKIDYIRVSGARNLTVTSGGDSGPGSLRQMLAALPAGGRIAPALAGRTILLTSGPMVLSKDVVACPGPADAVRLSVGGRPSRQCPRPRCCGRHSARSA